MAKKIRFFRHSLKENGFISKAGYQLIRDKKDSFLKVEKYFVSKFVRTMQTASEIMAVQNQTTALVIQLPEIGNQSLESILFSNKQFMELFRRNPNLNIYKALKKCFNAGEIKEMELESSNMIHQIAEKMHANETVIAVGHNPYITMAYNGYYGKNIAHENMNEMDYIDFEI